MIQLTDRPPEEISRSDIIGEGGLRMNQSKINQTVSIIPVDLYFLSQNDIKRSQNSLWISLLKQFCENERSNFAKLAKNHAQ